MQLKNYEDEPPLELEANALKWWRQKQERYSLLVPLARDLLAMPGSTAALERAFSSAALIWSAKRATIDKELGCDILFCHENIKRGLF